MTLKIRTAKAEDAKDLCALLNPIIRAGGTTAHRTEFDTKRMQEVFISPPRLISCFVAIRGDRLLGFQSLEWCDPEWTHAGKLSTDWGIIASFVDQAAQGQGVGRGLFEATGKAAKDAGVVKIDATIRRENASGLQYYAAMGFEDYNRDELRLSKCLIP